MRTWCKAFSAVLLSLSSVAYSQNATTSLRGAVKDPSGAAVPGATVDIEDAAIGFHASGVSNGQGEYSFQQLQPGEYTVKVVAPGFGAAVVHATLLVAQPATVNATLSVQVANTTVEVTSQATLVNTTDATIGNAIDNQTIMALPSEGRQPETLLALQPGVLFIGSSNSGESRNGVVSGARADQTNITLDGVDNNDQVFPSAFSGVLRSTLDSLEEFRVTTSNANADQGRSSGGQVNMVTRSGTNVVHGALYEYNRNTFGVANDWFNKSSQIQSGNANRPGKLIRNTYGVRLGGPIKRDRIFLFGNYEGNRQNEAAPVVRTVPTASFRAGTISYKVADGSVVALSRPEIAGMDPNCSGLGTCPQGPGVNPAVLAVLNQYPLPNGSLTGDGLNTASYTFNSPIPIVQNVYISRADFNPSDRHRFYVRGSFQNDTTAGKQYFPGQAASSTQTDDSRGLLANYTWTLSPNLVNNVRYGFVRQSYATRGVGSGNYVTFRSIDTTEATTRSNTALVPLHNVIDDVTWTKGKHTLQAGANYRRFTYNSTTDAHSFNSALTNASWLKGSHLASTGGTFDPAAFGHPAVSGTFRTNYDYAMTALAGLVTQETDNFNYALSADGTTGTQMGVGVPVGQSYRSNELEYYIQDAFKPTSNLTLTVGIRHTILQTPYEIHGQQVQPTIGIHDWFLNRGVQAALGNSVQPEIQFAPSGQARGGKPLYPMNWGNIAPRFAFAYSPAPSEGILHRILGGAGHSSIRGGFGMYYDHFGQGLVANYAARGSFSLSTSLNNPASNLTADTSPRFTGIHDLPGLVATNASSIKYPQTPPDDPYTTGFAITNGLDDRLKTPYSEVFNLSVQRQMKSFTLEVDYVGRLGRHLLQSMDLAQPLDLVDPKSGMDYYTAATLLAKASDAGQHTISSIPYWEDMFPEAASSGNSATQQIYSDEFNPDGGYNVRGNETELIADLDIFCQYGCPGTHYGRYWPLQYSSLFATGSNGTSNYNSAQVILRHPMSHDVQFDISYTLSKSMDLGSDTESNPSGQTGADGVSTSYGMLLDAFNPRKNYAVSDFDTRHLLTADWVLGAPFGHGQRFGGGSSRLMDALIGGWSVSGIVRASSGLPWGIYSGAGWGTNWQWQSAMVQTGPIKMRKHLDVHGSPQVFDDPLQALANLRTPYPGEIGQRNQFRGDGYFNMDSGVHKTVHVSERVGLQLAWEVFNVTNTPRFDVHSLDSESTDDTQLGVYGALLGSGAGGSSPARRMQLSGRIEF
ncbi:MAG TPA: carboxypeptidase regulatory-like domain-containing protein [Acidobacteriaceae bacterium]|nr:carboxypeptidase regulatory-like domain-containing protein [Acidobacteriaceae bacterium]